MINIFYKTQVRRWWHSSKESLVLYVRYINVLDLNFRDLSVPYTGVTIHCLKQLNLSKHSRAARLYIRLRYFTSKCKDQKYSEKVTYSRSRCMDSSVCSGKVNVPDLTWRGNGNSTKHSLKFVADTWYTGALKLLGVCKLHPQTYSLQYPRKAYRGMLPNEVQQGAGTQRNSSTSTQPIGWQQFQPNRQQGHQGHSTTQAICSIWVNEN